MSNVQIGDKVRVKPKKDWPDPPGYVLANAEGTVVKWIENDEAVKDFQDQILVQLEKATGTGEVYIGNNMCFLVDDLEKI